MNSLLLTDQTALVNLVIGNNWPKVAENLRALGLVHIDTEEEVRSAISDFMSEQDNEALAFALNVPIIPKNLSPEQETLLIEANNEIGGGEKSFLGVVTGVAGIVSTLFGGKTQRAEAQSAAQIAQAQAQAQIAAANKQSQMIKYLMYGGVGIALVFAIVAIIKVVKR